jgi:hypothetical protein
MPEAIDSRLATRIAAGVTSLCQLLEITRRDGVIYRFSTATRNKTFTVDSTPVEFTSGGFDPTDITSTFDEGIGTLLINAYLNNTLTELDVRLGKFDYATAKIYWADWQFPDYGVIKRFSGIIQSSSVTNESAATFELVGQMALATRILGEVRTPNCRALFGDDRCKFPVADFIREGNITAIDGKTYTVDLSIGGGNPQDPDAHSWWRIRMVPFKHNPPVYSHGYIRIAEVEFHDTVGGSNIATGGTIFASESGDIGGNYSAANAFDGDHATYWGSFNWNTDQYIGYHFAAPVTIAEIAVRVSSIVQHVPSACILEYSDDNVTWAGVPGMNKDGLSWAASEQKLFARDDGSYIGSYQAGMLEFTEGQNIGEVLDILDYSETADVATIKTALSAPRPVEIGEVVNVWPGCNKTLARCRYWNNVVNYRGEPYVPTGSYQGQNRIL